MDVVDAARHGVVHRGSLRYGVFAAIVFVKPRVGGSIPLADSRKFSDESTCWRFATPLLSPLNSASVTANVTVWFSKQAENDLAAIRGPVRSRGCTGQRQFLSAGQENGHGDLFQYPCFRLQLPHIIISDTDRHQPISVQGGIVPYAKMASIAESAGTSQ